MKKLLFITLLICIFLDGFSQKSDSLSPRKIDFFHIYRHKGKIFNDSGTFKITPEIIALRNTLKRKEVDLIFTDRQRIIPLDSVPKSTPFCVNNILTINHNLLKYIPNYEVVHVRKARHEGMVMPRTGDFNKTKIMVKGIYETAPKVLIYQAHPNLPKDFFMINEKTFEAQRYSCSVESPLWDFFVNPSPSNSSKPVYVLDGRIQTSGFELGDISEKNIKMIEVFDPEDGKQFFGRKGSNGIVAIATKKYTGDLLPTLRNIRIIGETEYEMGRWKIISDTTVENLNAYWNYRKQVFLQNGPVYMIGGEEETQQVNRKNIEMERVLGIEIKRENIKLPTEKFELNMDSTSWYVKSLNMTPQDFTRRDTVFIKTGIKANIVALNNQIDAIFMNLQIMRNGGQLPRKSSKIPLYFVDNQEITPDKLKEFKPKELEFVESLEGCDAISKYGKRAEFGVVIYRKKK
jgi:hypothetical protein